MKFKEYSHRHADAIIANDEKLKEKYNEFINALESISEDELIERYFRNADAYFTYGALEEGLIGYK